MNGHEFEGILKEAVMAYSGYHPITCWRGQQKPQKSCHIRHSGQDLNQEPPKSLPLDQPVW
jgi:hypothetical protein